MDETAGTCDDLVDAAEQVDTASASASVATGNGGESDATPKQHSVETVSRFLRHVEAREARMAEQLRAAQRAVAQLETDLADARESDQIRTSELSAELLRQLQAQREQLQNEATEEHEDRIRELSDCLQQKNTMLQHAAQLCEHQKEQLHSLESTLTAKAKDLETLNACVRHFEINEARIDEQLRSNQSTVAALTRDLAKSQRELDQWTRDVPSVFSRKITEQREQVHREISLQYQDRIEQLETALSQCKELLDTQREEIDAARESANKEILQAHERDLQRIAQLELAIEERDRIAASTAEAIQREAGKIAERLQDAQAQMAAQYKTRICQLETSLAEARALYERAQSYADSLRMEIDRIRARWGEEVKELGRVHEFQRDQWNDEIQALTEKCNGLAQYVRKLEDMVAVTSDLDRVKGFQHVLDQHIERIRDLEARVAERDWLSEQASERLEASKEEIRQTKADAAGEIAKLRETLSTERANLAAQLSEIRRETETAHARRVEFLEEEVAKRQQLLESTNEVMDTLSKENAAAKNTQEARLEELRESQSRLQKKLQEQHERDLGEAREQIEKLHDAAEEARVQHTEQLQRMKAAYSKQIETQKENAAKLTEDIQHMQDLLNKSKDSDLLQRQDAHIRRLTKSLAAIRDACNTSTAARALLERSCSEINLGELFDALDSNGLGEPES